MIQFEKFTLDNGLRVLVHEDFSTPLATMNLLYDVGARDEDPTRTGFAHLFEHLMFGGSINIPSYDEPLQEVGGENNAFTNNDITNYYLTVPAENIETGFWLESDRMLGLAFSEKSLEVQRHVVIEEFKQRYLNQPYGDVWLLLREMAYRHHPYRWATIGREIAHIEKASMEEVKAFFQKYYHPANAIMAIAGAVKAAEVRRLCNKWFSPIPPQRVPKRQLPQEPEPQAFQIKTVERQVPASVIYRSYLMAGRNDEDYFAQDLLSDFLGRGQSSLLHTTLVREQKLFTEISAYVMGSADPGLLIIQGKLAPGTEAEKASKAIDICLEQCKSQPIEPTAVNKVKQKAISSFVFESMGIANKAFNLAFYEWLGDANRINTEVEKLEAITTEKLQTSAHNILNKNRACELRYLSLPNQ